MSSLVRHCSRHPVTDSSRERSPPATLAVNVATKPHLPVAAAGEEVAGGGAPRLWFYGALSPLVAIRKDFRRRQERR